jgi:hypothetical protein
LPNKPSRALVWVGLILALLGIATALLVQHGAQDRQGPQAMAVLDGQHVALSVNDELWLLDAQGALLARRTLTELGLPGIPANLARAPDGRIAASLRGQTTVYWLDSKLSQVVGRSQWQWPAHLRSLLDHAHTLAIGPQGQFAVATAGGHRVLLFGPDGRFLAITPPDTYRFTNGLWWTASSLWTTDTNRFALVELDPASLTVRRRIELGSGGHRAPYLSWATAYPAPASSPNEALTTPLATVVRMANGMRQGRVVDVLPDGRELPFNMGERGQEVEPQDLAWLGHELLLVDGHGHRVMGFGRDRQRLSDFGSGEVQALLRQGRQRQQRMDRLYQAGLLLGVAGLALALLTLRQQRLKQDAQAMPTLQAELKTLGTPVLSREELVRAAWRLAGPWLLLVGWVLLPKAFDALRLVWPGIPMVSKQTGTALTLLGALALLTWLLRRQRRAALDPDQEALLNVVAVQSLSGRQGWLALKEPGEQLRETFLIAPVGALKWVLLSDRRLLVLRLNLRDRVLESAWHRSDIASVSLPPLKALSWWQRAMRWPVDGNWLRIAMRDGTVIEGTLRSAVTAQRVARLLGLPAQRASASQSTRAVLSAGAGQTRRTWLPVTLSLLVPGSGQWLQGRPSTALLMFLCATAWLALVTWPPSLVWYTGVADIRWQRLIEPWCVQLAFGLVSALDAWQLRQRPL